MLVVPLTELVHQVSETTKSLLLGETSEEDHCHDKVHALAIADGRRPDSVRPENSTERFHLGLVHLVWARAAHVFLDLSPTHLVHRTVGVCKTSRSSFVHTHPGRPQSESVLPGYPVAKRKSRTEFPTRQFAGPACSKELPPSFGQFALGLQHVPTTTFLVRLGHVPAAHQARVSLGEAPGVARRRGEHLPHALGGLAPQGGGSFENHVSPRLWLLWPGCTLRNC
mmetsp:Transcript_28873/g.76176  ORF Transcript_28873/g.76176 Transcript_28873/m.76176 type:complete len:225 (-) Transcript_28873:616-1290(-)